VINTFTKDLSAAELFERQSRQYSEVLVLSDTVPANTTKLGKLNISSLGHFLCQFITGSFTSLNIPAAAIVDTGVSYLSGQLSDSAGNRKLFNDRIPLDLLLSPGHRRDATSTTVLTDPASNNLFYPIEFEYLFASNADILFDVENESNTPNYYEIAFHGIRIISDEVLTAANEIV